MIEQLFPELTTSFNNSFNHYYVDSKQINVELPGFTKDEIEIRQEGDTIFIKAESSREDWNKKTSLRVYSKKEVKSAKMENGLLQLMFEEPRNNVIKIE